MLGRPKGLNARSAALWTILLLVSFCTGCSGTRQRLNDEKTEQAIRQIRDAERTFRSTNGRFGRLNELVDAGLVPRAFTDNVGFGHRFDIKPAINTYEALAVPIEKNDQYAYVGWSFYLDESGVIRGSAYGRANGYAVAGKKDPPIRTQ